VQRRDWLRILDANLNRAREALRVVEDVARLGRPVCAAEAERLRGLRHAVAGLPVGWGIDAAALHGARDVAADPGAAAASASGADDPEVVGRNLARAAEALRALEEAARALALDPAPAAALRFAVYDVEVALRPSRRHTRLQAARLCVLVDAAASDRALPELASAVAAAGAPMIQLRSKGLVDGAWVALAREVVAAATPHQTLVIVNDRPDIARVVGADGVHLGREDLSVADARVVVGGELLIGATAHDAAQATAAEAAGADYLGCGTVFASTVKPERPACGPAAVAAIAAARAIPVFAIGGITPANLPACRAAGVERVAVASAVGRAPDPAAVVAQILAALQS